jgi:hypothetical protein
MSFWRARIPSPRPRIQVVVDAPTRTDEDQRRDWRERRGGRAASEQVDQDDHR